MLATVSTGHGLSVIPMRLGVPPEIVVVSVEPIKNKKAVTNPVFVTAFTSKFIGEKGEMVLL